METVRKKLIRELTLLDPGLIGCHRRNHWEERTETPWRWIRGNALLATLGEKKTIYTHHGDMQVFMLHNWLLQFRGGQWNADWMEDFLDTWSLLRASLYGEGQDELSSTILVVTEDKGELDVKMVSVPEGFDWKERVALIYDNYENQRRIPKSGPRALRMCKWCPQKQRCDALDKLRNETGDWHESYPYP